MTHEPIAYTALLAKTAVVSADGSQFGTVEAVLSVDEVDVFDGIVVSTEAGLRFVDADHVDAIFTNQVRTTLSQADVRSLPEPDGRAVYTVDGSDDTGESIADRFGRMFRRGKWKLEE